MLGDLAKRADALSHCPSSLSDTRDHVISEKAVSPIVWAILTGEYPPQTGGVSDYTQLVAEGLTALGDEVHIWAPPTPERDVEKAGITVHRLPDHFGLCSLIRLREELDRLPQGARIVVQYVPHSYGCKAMNLPFCIWLWSQRRRNNITVMYHEVAFPWVRRGRIVRHNVLAMVNRLMVCFVTRSAERLFVAIPGWFNMVRPSAAHRPLEWLPVPSNMALDASANRVKELRTQLLGNQERMGNRLVGHFGTFGPASSEALQKIVPALLNANGSIKFLCIGRGGQQFAKKLRSENPQLAARVLAVGPLAAQEVSEYLSSCDLLVQPYPDGISSRRTSAMAGLALGRPIVATLGPLTEPIWGQSGAVRLVNTVAHMEAQATQLLGNEEERASLGRAAARLYDERFSLRHTLTRLRGTTSGSLKA